MAAVEGWYRRASDNRRQLFALLEQIGNSAIPRPSGNHESMIDYDRHRLIKETLLEQVITAIVETSQAERFLLAAIVGGGEQPGEEESVATTDTMSEELRQAAELLAAALRGQRETAVEVCEERAGGAADERDSLRAARQIRFSQKPSPRYEFANVLSKTCWWRCLDWDCSRIRWN